jgi:hypothetical protein
MARAGGIALRGAVVLVIAFGAAAGGSQLALVFVAAWVVPLVLAFLLPGGGSGRERREKDERGPVCNEGSDEPERPLDRSPAPETPLETFARARGFRVVSPDAIAGDVRGVRVAIERTGTAGDAGVSIDVDAGASSAHAVEALRERLGPRLADYRIARLGRIARVEWLESGAADQDAKRLEEVLEAVVEASTLRRGAYR